MRFLGDSSIIFSAAGNASCPERKRKMKLDLQEKVVEEVISIILFLSVYLSTLKKILNYSLNTEKDISFFS